MFKLKRAYEAVNKEDGFRILVDRLWPRGMSKEKEHLDLWVKDIAPSNELRKKFGHDPLKWNLFNKEYKEELKSKSDVIQEIKDIEKVHKIVTLIYAAKDEAHNNAIVLKEVLEM